MSVLDGTGLANMESQTCAHCLVRKAPANLSTNLIDRLNYTSDEIAVFL